MKSLFSVALLGAFLAVTNSGCGDPKPTPAKVDPAKTEGDKTVPPGGRAPVKP